jgi:peptidyl-prolyl cis-trans isomerase D
MLDALRKGAGGWISQLLITLLVVAFGVWGVASRNVFSGFRSDIVASVGSTDIYKADFARRYEMAKRQLSQQLGQPVNDDQARLFQLPQQVLGSLVRDATLNDAARRMGLGISNQTLSDELGADPRFRDASGKFDRLNFTSFVRQFGFNETQYLEELRREYVRQQIALALTGGSKVPDVYLQALHAFKNDARKLSYLVLTAAVAGTVADPTSDELTKYFDAHKADYRAPEYRALAIMEMTPKDLAKPAEISDDDAKKAYDSQAQRWTTPERRKVEQIVFKDRAEADAAAAELAAGKTFDDLITERKAKPEDVDLGLVTRDKILDPKIADAAFGLAANSVSGIVDGGFGPAILRVTTVEPQVVKTFAEVKDDLKQEIATQRAVGEVNDQHDVIEDARAGGSTLKEIAGKYGLKLVTVAAVDKAGKDQAGNPVADIPGGEVLLGQAFQTDVGIANAPARTTDGGYAWYDVTAVTAARDRTLDEVKDKVVAALKHDKVDEIVTAKANELKDRLAKGEDIAKVAQELGLEVKTADNVTRETPPSGDLTAAAVQSAFGGPKGTAAVAPGKADQSKIVLVVTDTTVPPYFAGVPDLAQSQDRTSADMSNDLLSQYTVQLQSQVGLQLNQTALQQALGQGGDQPQPDM